jgi:hypothetical protein
MCEGNKYKELGSCINYELNAEVYWTVKWAQ